MYGQGSCVIEALFRFRRLATVEQGRSHHGNCRRFPLLRICPAGHFYNPVAKNMNVEDQKREAEKRIKQTHSKPRFLRTCFA